MPTIANLHLGVLNNLRSESGSQTHPYFCFYRIKDHFESCYDELRSYLKKDINKSPGHYY